ncbi:hypothetical protein L211DRAFT_545493 [Terfezia boudieri ATCC MYA-4762]|uniref:Uncharacterized protein n=1 Tax=Terfezia boudieri ATCC MYA-4762 TaxID=1051890 RepID=A0A3N4M219_9PEZI|nr:hypothetical protein L211DRAFT_545493 [Terfezia boudieri ATCC MYA-4762]
MTGYEQAFLQVMYICSRVKSHISPATLQCGLEWVTGLRLQPGSSSNRFSNISQRLLNRMGRICTCMVLVWLVWYVVLQ